MTHPDDDEIRSRSEEITHGLTWWISVGEPSSAPIILPFSKNKSVVLVQMIPMESSCNSNKYSLVGIFEEWPKSPRFIIQFILIKEDP